MALFNILSTAIVSGINFITIPVFTRMLDTSGFGLINVYTAWVQVGTIFVGLQANGSIASARANLPESEQGSYQISVLVMSLIPFSVILGLAVLLIQPLSSLLLMPPPLIICAVLQSFGAFVVSLFSMRYIFRKQAQLNLLISVGLCVVTTLLSVVLILFVFSDAESAFYGRAYGLMLPNLVLGIALFASLVFSGNARVRVAYWRFCLGLTLPLIFHALSQIVLAQTGKLAIQQFSGDSAAGVYSIAVVVVSLMAAIYSALNNAFVPFMYDDLSGKTGEGVKQDHFRNYMRLFTVGSLAFMLLSPEVLKLMSPESYWTATSLLPPLIVGQYCVFLYSFPVNYEFFKMKTGSIALGTLLAAALNIVLTLMLIPVFGMMGAAFATMVAYLFLFLFHFSIARFWLGDRNYPSRYLFGGLAVVVLAAAGCYALGSLLAVRWAIGVVLLVYAGARVVRTRQIF
ncbi:MAG: oligosaccharide flippase family protein [Eggerthellaceae bacterium]|nr:oligosaccharide flippase family protein [Eggerthellaceae bacterium]